MRTILRLLSILIALAWPSLALAQNGVPYSANVQMPTFVSASSGAGALADGTSGAPSIAFASEPTLGFYRSASTTVSMPTGTTLNPGALTPQGAMTFQNTGTSAEVRALGGVLANATGTVYIANSARTMGVTFKVDALPTVSACGAGSPAVTALSTPYAGSVTVGTGGPTSCLITFNGTAFSAAPFCGGSVATSTAGNVRAMGYLSTTTQVTITPTAAWADGSLVTWACPANK